MYAKVNSTQIITVAARGIALLILIISLMVLAAWHNTQLFPSLHSRLVAMAYSTALCFLFSGVGVLCLTWRRFYIARFFSLVILAVAVITLIEICWSTGFQVNNRLMFTVHPMPASPVPMAATTAVSFVLVSISMLLSSVVREGGFGKTFIFLVCLQLLTVAIAFIALLGHGIGLLPAFVWLGIRMAPLTAVTLIVLAIGFLLHSYRPALMAFSRLSFFSHMVVAFGFMTLLFVGIGSIVLAQIDSVSSIMRELHQNPLQVNQSAVRIREQVERLNRDLKNIAIQPDLARSINVTQRAAEARQSIASDIAKIRTLDDELTPQLQIMERDLRRWDELISAAYQHLQRENLEVYRSITLNESQQQVVALEHSLITIFLQTQTRIQALNVAANDIQQDAKRLIAISVASFLSMGLLVAYLITRLLSNHLHQIRQAMLDIAHKREGVKIPFIDYNQEIGDMARALAVFAANINAGRRMETRMRQIIEAAPNGIVMVNEGGHIEIVNQQAEKIFGYDRSELLGKTVEQLMPARMAPGHPQHRHNFFINPSPRAMGSGRDLFGLKKDGEEFPIEIGLAPIETDDGLKVLASIVDISERKKSAQMIIQHQLELEKSNKELARINKELETFAYVASHDLKSPLRGIAQLSSWIEEDLQAQDYDNVPGHTEMLRSRILRMEKLLDDLLIFYRAGKMDASPSVIDVKAMAIELFDIQNNKPGLHLEVVDDLPIFTSLSTPFEQVLRNLFSNAIKHHDQETGVVSLTYRKLDTGFLEFAVCDDGPGIPEQYQERVFGMFQTLKPRDEVEGSGMGLALIKKIIENYGGNISVRSEGRGTCFTFTWPTFTQGQSHNA